MGAWPQQVSLGSRVSSLTETRADSQLAFSIPPDQASCQQEAGEGA